jgi:hypothetical protein
MFTVFKDNSAEEFLRAEHKVCVKIMEIKHGCNTTMYRFRPIYV